MQSYATRGSVEALGFVGIVALALHTTGCNRTSTPTVHLQKTNAFAPFGKIDRFELQWRFKNADVFCYIPEPKQRFFQSLFEFGTPIPNDKKRVALGDMKLVVEGKDIHLAILDIADDECALLVTSTGELWAGISKSNLVKFVKSCLDDSSQK
jgi:hypothetical protein